MTQPQPLRGLYALTDTHLLQGRLLSAVTEALKGGVRILQYRDKTRSAEQRLQEARALAALCRQYDCLFLINDDIDLARDCGADGVHLGQGDGDVASARARLGDQAIIGVTCHASLELALTAQAQGADYVAFGAFFASTTKPQATLAPLPLLYTAKTALQLPVVAIGGISVDNANQVITAGAEMVAVVHSLFSADDICSRAQQFNRFF